MKHSLQFHFVDLINFTCVCMCLRATQIKTYSWDNAQVILVGNKCDLEDDRLVATEDGQRLANELGEFHTPTQKCIGLQ